MATDGVVNTSSYQGRYYQVTWAAKQSIEDNTSTISWALNVLGGSASWYAERTLSVVIAENTVYSKTARVERYTGTITSGSVVIKHDSAGNASFSISIQAAVYTSAVNCTGSKSFTLDTIPRASTVEASNGTLGTAQTLTVDRKSTSFTHTITYWSGSASGTICTKSTSTSISWTPPESLASQCTDATTMTVGLKIETFNGSTSIGTRTKYISCAIPDTDTFAPSCSISVSDATGYATTYGYYLKGLSKMAVTVTATKAYDSPITSYKTTANGSSYTSSSFTTDVLKSYGTLTVSATVTDKRGRPGYASESVSVWNYSAPSIAKLTVGRCDSDGTANDQGEYVKVTYSYSIDYIRSKNSKGATLKYKKSSNSSYTTVQLSASYSVTDESYIFAADSGSSYDVLLTVSDDFNTTTRSTSASTAFTLMHFNSDGAAMAIGKISEMSNTFEVGIDAYFHNPVKAAQSLNVRVLGERISIPSNSDLNDYVTIGAYRCGSSSGATTLSNCPTSVAFTLDVYNSAGGSATTAPSSSGVYVYLIQELTTYTGSDKYIRRVSFNGTTTASYGDWNRYVFDSDLSNYVLASSLGDYVSSYGTTTTSDSIAWTWRKWNSGVAECWGKKNFGTLSITASWGSMYESTTALTATFPSIFSETPKSINVGFLYGGGSAGLIEMSGQPTSTSTGNFYVYKATSQSSMYNTTIGFYVVGVWK